MCEFTHNVRMIGRLAHSLISNGAGRNVMSNNFPLIRHSERVDFKRCTKKWFWRWRMGLVPREKTFGALDLGNWVHEAFAGWYSQPNRKRFNLATWLTTIADREIASATQLGAPDYQLEKASELAMLGEAMLSAYQKRYGADEDVRVIQAEIPLEFSIADETGKILAVHKLKPDLVYSDKHDDVWLMEHKTAAQIRLEHLVIDDQARPYVAMAELPLRKAGLIKKNQVFKGVMYNFARKALPDERVTDAAGRSLNKNGTVSKRQPIPTFVRHPVTLSRAAKRIALLRLQREALLITGVATAIREKRIHPNALTKTPHSSCPKQCPFFGMCVVEDQGGQIKDMIKTMYIRRNPYEYDEETTDIPPSFELS